MNDNTKRNSGCTISLSTLLTGIFVILKLTGTITWSWFWVFFPTILSVGLSVVVIGLIASIVGIAALVEKSRFEKEFSDKYKRTLGRSASYKDTYSTTFEEKETVDFVRNAAKKYDHLSRKEKIDMLKDELNRVQNNIPQDVFFIDNDEDQQEKPYTHNMKRRGSK